MTTYTINVVNKSGSSKSYVVFMAPPVVTANGDQPVVYANAWATLENLTDGGFDSVTYTVETPAVPDAPSRLASDSGLPPEAAPAPTFYVADEDYAQGQLIDIASATTGTAVIDFTATTRTTATVTQTPDDGWTVDYG